MIDFVKVGFVGPAKKMSLSDLTDTAQKSGYEVASFQALMSVESNGSGFDAAGRPVLLPEPHVFFTQLWDGKTTAPDWKARQARQATAIQAGLAYRVRGSAPYPVTQDARYSRVMRMMAIDSSAALKSCSWGIGQVMGFNFASCGYPDVESMIADAMQSELLQFMFIVHYIEHAGLASALKRHDWAAIAGGYNGPGNVAAYAAKLAAAYALYSKKGAPVATAKQVVTSAPIRDGVQKSTADLNDASLANAKTIAPL